MYRFLVSLLLFSCLYSEEQNDFVPSFDETAALVNLEGEPNSIAAGCVNVISGDFFDIEQDLVIQGAEPLILERGYSSSDHSNGSLCKGWHFNLQGTVKCFHGSEQYVFKGALVKTHWEGGEHKHVAPGHVRVNN